MDKPLVSVIIPTFNSERFLERCLRSIRGQTYGNIEVVVVDNSSTDRTREIASKFEAMVVLCRGIRSKARNFGASYSKGEFIFSVDSDMELTNNVVSECVGKIDSGFDAVIIPEISIGEGFWAKCRVLEKLCYIGDDLIEAARFFKKSVFEYVNGYDAELEFGEDWDINQRIRRGGFSVGRGKAYIRHNEGTLSLWKTISKKHYYAKTLKLYRMKHPEEASQQLKMIRPALVKNWRVLAKDPVHTIGLFFMKTCEFAVMSFRK